MNRNYTADGLNRYTAAGGVTPTYDTRGNLTSAGATTYTYSSENMLLTATGGVSLAYDPLLRLYQTAGGSTTRFAYDGQSMIAEYDGGGTLLRRYVHGLGSDDPILWYEGAGFTQRRGLHADHQGSIVAVTDSAGTSIATNAYDPWGIPNAGNQGRFGYTGQIWIPQLGMWHYKARLYSPTLGRFLQTDPIGYEDQVNLYAYVGNDPTNLTDPTGMERTSDYAHTCNSGNSRICGNAQDEAARQERREQQQNRPTQPVHGGRLTQAQVLCRSCHGVETRGDHRYATEAEAEAASTIAGLIPAARVAQVPRQVATTAGRLMQRGPQGRVRSVSVTFNGVRPPSRIMGGREAPRNVRGQTVDRNPELRREQQFMRDFRNGQGQADRTLLQSISDYLEAILKPFGP